MIWLTLISTVSAIVEYCLDFANYRLCNVEAGGVERSNKAGCWIFHLDFIWKVQSWSTKGKFGVDAAAMHPPDDFIEKLNSLLSSSSSTQHAQYGQVCLFFWQLVVESLLSYFMIWFSKWKQKTGIFFSPNLKISKFPPHKSALPFSDCRFWAE